MNTINVTQQQISNFIVRRMSVSKDRSDFNRQIMPIQLVEEINTSQSNMVVTSKSYTVLFYL